MSIENKKIFIFGGTGTIGRQLIKKYIINNFIINYSRDEKKHWELDSTFESENLKHIIGDIINYENISTSLVRENPNIIIITSALKHIDRCEYSCGESLNTNIIGAKNIVDCIENNKEKLKNLEKVIFISTDKACNPVSVYGLCKSLAEKIVTEKSKFIKDIKFLCVRFGNVLNSSGSILPMLHRMGEDKNIHHFKLTHKAMTRFIISINDAIELIHHAILYGSSGDVIVPKLKSANITHLIEIFSEIYNKPIKIVGLRSGEKMYETLINDTESMRATETQQYYYIKPQYLGTILNEHSTEYTSRQDIMSKEELYSYLKNLDLI